MTNDGLVAFNQTSGLAGTQLVPDLAVSLPTPTDGGRTYTFRLRPDIRYSNGRPVEASDVRATFERDFEIGKHPARTTTASSAPPAARSTRSAATSREGIVANDAARTVTFHLVAPDPKFLYKLALPLAYVLPAGTRCGRVGTHPLPATGPYMIARYRPQHVAQSSSAIRRFHEWSKAAQPDGYPDRDPLRDRSDPDPAVKDVIHGRADAFGSIGGAPSLELLEQPQDPVRGPGALEPVAAGLRPLPQHARPAVQQPRRAQSAELRRRPGGGSPARRRARRRPGDLPDPAPRLPRLPALLPLPARAPRPRQGAARPRRRARAREG